MIQEKNRAETVFLIAATAAGAFLRFYRIGKECLWFDEMCSLWRASRPLGVLIDELARRMLFPPLYFVLLKVWGYVAGQGPVALRSFSSIWGVAAIPIAYFLAREMFGRKAAVVSTILLVFSFFNIYYSQEAKMYAMWWTLVLASNLFFVRAVKYPKRWPDLFLYVAVTAAGLWTYNFMVLVILSHAIYLLAILRPLERAGKWIMAYITVAVIYSPWVLTFLAKNLFRSRGGGVQEAIAFTWKAVHWIPVPTLKDFVMNFIILTSGMKLYKYDLDTWADAWHIPFLYSPYLCLLALMLLLYPIVRAKSGRWRFPALIVLLILFPTVAVFVYSCLKTPIWHPRYLGFISALTFIAIGYGYSLSDRKLIAGTAVGIILVLNLSVLDFYYSGRVKMSWDDLVVYLAPRAEEGDHVIFAYPELSSSLDYYWRLDRERRRKRLKLEYPYWENDKIRDKIEDFDSVWLVLNYSAPRRRRRCSKKGVEVPGYREEIMYFGNGLEIIHYVKSEVGGDE
jgi:uncharacterized membrane protein